MGGDKMICCFYAKKDIDYSKYDFVESDKEWVVWRGTRRITIKKKDYSMSFNMITNEILKIFMDMVKDDVIYVKKQKAKVSKHHYIGLSDSEYELIQKIRNEAQGDDL